MGIEERTIKKRPREKHYNEKKIVEIPQRYCNPSDLCIYL